MCTAFSSRQSLVSQSWRTSSSSGRSLLSRRAFSSFGVISLMDYRGGPRHGPPTPAHAWTRPGGAWRASDGGPRLGDIQKSELPSARRRAADQEVGEPAVHDLRVLDVRKVAARVEPAHAAAREALGGLRTVRGGDGRILTTVDQEDGHVERGDGAPIVGAALDEVVGERAYRAQPRPACGGRGAGRVLPADEKGHLVGGRRAKTSRDGRAIERRAAAAGP